MEKAVEKAREYECISEYNFNRLFLSFKLSYDEFLRSTLESVIYINGVKFNWKEYISFPRKENGRKIQFFRKGLYSPSFIHSMTVFSDRKENDEMEIDGDLIHMASHRYQLFATKGIVCVNCGIEGQYYAKESTNINQGWHFNLYALDENGEEVLMTKDHIFPRSAGGSDSLDNYQPMCIFCNGKKGSNL